MAASHSTDRAALSSTTTSATTSDAGSTANTPGVSVSPTSPFFHSLGATPTTPTKTPATTAHPLPHIHPSASTTTSSPSRANLTHRTVCCSIPVCTRTSRVLMVTSRKHHDKWIFPKGGLEVGESLVEAAVRESWEEAGTKEGMDGYTDWREIKGPELGTAPESHAESSTKAMRSPPHVYPPAPSLNPTQARDPWTAREVYQATSRSGNGQREIRYHVFEIEIDGEDLPDEWPESSQRKRELVTVPEVIRRCVAWRNEKNTKLELVDGFRQTGVYKRWKERVERGEVDGPPRGAAARGSRGGGGETDLCPDKDEDKVATSKADFKAEEAWALAQEVKDEGLFRVGGEGRVMNAGV